MISKGVGCITCILLLGITTILPVPTRTMYDNGMVSWALPLDYKVVDDYSYMTQTLIQLTPLIGNEPQGIISVQTPLASSEIKTAQEIYESESSEVNTHDYMELTNGGMWSLTCDSEEMVQIYYTYKDTVIRALVTQVYLASTGIQRILEIGEDIEVYGTRVSLPGESIQQAYEALASEE